MPVDDLTYPIVAEKWREPSLHGPEQFLAQAFAAGWKPGPIPAGAVFVFDHRIRKQLEGRPDAVEAPELAPGNAVVFRIGSAVASCLSPGAGAMVTQMQNLAHLGTERFVIVGTAGSISPRVEPGAVVLADAAVRDDGITQHYLPPAKFARGSPDLTGQLAGLLPDALRGRTWTMPIPYRITAREVTAHGEEGVLCTEMEVAALFGVAEALGVAAAAVLVITTTITPTQHIEDWQASSEPLSRAVAAALTVAAGT